MRDRSENATKTSPQQQPTGRMGAMEMSVESGRTAPAVQPVNNTTTGNTQSGNGKGSSRMGTFRRLWHIDRNTS